MADLSPDTSVYQKLAQQPQSQMDIGSLLSLIQRSRELNTQSGIAAAIRANPNDPTAAFSAASRDPNVFMGFGDISNAIHAQAARQDLQTQQFTRMSNIAGTYLNGRIDDAAMNSMAIQMQRSGMPQQDIDNFLRQMPPESDQAGRRKLVQQMQLLASGHAADINWRNVGVGGAPVPVTGAQEFWAAQSGPQGAGGPPPPTARPTAAPRVPQSEAAEDTAANVTKEVQATLPKPGTMAEPSTADRIKFENSGRQFANDLSQTSDYRNNINALEKLIPTLRKLGPEGTGAPNQLIAAMSTFLHNIGVPVPTDKTKLLQTAKKYMANVVGSLSAGQTDARLWQAQTGSPNPELLQQTNLDLAKQMLGLQRLHLGQVAEYQRVGSGLGGNYYTDWGSRWNAQQDPTAYAWDAYTPDERKEYLSGSDAAFRKRFRSSLAAADRTKGLFSGQ